MSDNNLDQKIGRTQRASIQKRTMSDKPHVVPLLTELFDNLNLDYLAYQDIEFFDQFTYDILSCVGVQTFTEFDYYDLKCVLTTHNSVITAYLGSDWIQHDWLLGSLTDCDIQDCVELYNAAKQLNADISVYLAKRELLMGQLFTKLSNLMSVKHSLTQA